MRSELVPFLALLAAAPAAYAWWSGRTIRRSIDDPALPELLLARQRRLVQVALGAIIASTFLYAPTGFSILVLFGVLVAQYPLRRAVFGDTWSFVQYVRYTTFSWIASGGLWLFPIVASGIVVQLAREWVPAPSTRQTLLGLGLGVAAAAVYLAWHRRFARVWLALNQASPIGDSAHAGLLPSFEAVLERAGARLAVRPAIYRYGAPGGQVTNAVALCSLHDRAVAMSDTLLANLDASESTAIFAHEIAHHEHYTNAKLRKRRLAARILATLLALVPVLQLMSVGEYSLVIDVLFLFAILMHFARGHAGHRAHETECDLRAVDLTGDAESVIRALTKIHVLSRMPRRFSQEFERAATHPSLARRIQAIRAHASMAAEPAPAGPTVVASTTAGSYVALDDARSYWFDGVPTGTALDVAALRDAASSYRALAYGELVELRLVAERPRTLHARDLAGRAWSVGIGDEDVARVQTALDRVDAKLGAAPAEPKATNLTTARLVASLLLIAAMMAGMWGTSSLVAVIALFAPTAAVLAAAAATALGQSVITFGENVLGTGHETLALAAAVLVALWLAWIAWRRTRTPSGGESTQLPHAKRWSRTFYAVLALGVIIPGSGLVLGGGSSPAELLGDSDTAQSAVGLLGLGAALLTARRRSWRLAGGGALTIGLAGLIVGVAGERWATPPTPIAWTTGRLSLVASVPMGRDAHSVELSPAGTRFLSRRYRSDPDDERDYSPQLVTGSIPLRGDMRTLSALDAALPSETALLVLRRIDDDSLELRLERQDADSASRVVWRRTLPNLTDARIQLDARNGRWLVSGKRVEHRLRRLVTIAGAMDGSDVRSAEIPADTLYAPTLYSYRDGATLVVAMTPLAGAERMRRSRFGGMLAALRGDALSWTISRYDESGGHALTQLHGYPTCAGGSDADVAVCVEQGRRGTRLWSVARNGALTDLGRLSSSYERATASAGGHVVASSHRSRSLAVIDVARRQGVRVTLPSDGSFLGEVSATDSLVVAVLGGRGGTRIAVYRLEPATSAQKIVSR